jgi:hypothetical protein
LSSDQNENSVGVKCCRFFACGVPDLATAKRFDFSRENQPPKGTKLDKIYAPEKCVKCEQQGPSTAEFYHAPSTPNFSLSVSEKRMRYGVNALSDVEHLGLLVGKETLAARLLAHFGSLKTLSVLSRNTSF